MKKYLAELVGTFILVFVGCGAVVISGADRIGFLGIGIAFGLALTGAAYGIGPISGCHINPAVSLAAWIAGRMSIADMIGYWVAQFAGALIGAWAVLALAMGSATYSLAINGLATNGWGPGYQGEYGIGAAMLYEFLATLVFIVVILGSTQKSAPSGFAGLAIGITLMVLHLVGLRITGVSLNPARSLGPALFVGGAALKQVWLFLVFPSAGGIVAGLLFRTKLLATE